MFENKHILSLWLQVKVAYVNFVNHCYVDTEVEMKEIYTSNHIWKLFEDFTVDMARVTALYWCSDTVTFHGVQPAITYSHCVCVCVLCVCLISCVSSAGL